MLNALSLDLGSLVVAILDTILQIMRLWYVHFEAYFRVGKMSLYFRTNNQVRFFGEEHCLLTKAIYPRGVWVSIYVYPSTIVFVRRSNIGEST